MVVDGGALEGEVVVKGKGGDDERVCGGDDDQGKGRMGREGAHSEMGASARTVRDVFCLRGGSPRR